MPPCSEVREVMNVGAILVLRLLESETEGLVKVKFHYYLTDGF